MNNKQILKDLASNQDRIAKAICIAATGAFLALLLGIASFSVGNGPAVTYLLVCIVGILTFAFIGLSLHMSLIESSAKSEELESLKLEIQNRMDSVEKLIQLGNKALRSLDTQSKLLTEIGDLGRMRSCNMLGRVVGALNIRLAKYVSLMEEGNLESLEMAFDLIDAPLEFDNTQLNSLSGEQIPLLEKEHWEVTVHSLISELGVSIEDEEQQAA
jgi:hypothetical protein